MKGFIPRQHLSRLAKVMGMAAVMWCGRAVVLLAVGVLVVPFAGEAQQAARPVKIGVLCAGACPFGGHEGALPALTTALERVGLVKIGRASCRERVYVLV